MSRYGESDVSTNEISSGTVDVLAVFGADLTVAVWTASAERLWGWSADEALHRPLAELLASGGPAPSDVFTGDLWSGRVRVSRRDGRETSADLRVVPLSTDGSGGWLVWQPDISARPGLDPATLNTFCGHSPIALVVWDRDLRCLWFNRTVHNQDIYRSGPELGGHITDLVDHRYPEFLESSAMNVLDSGVPILGHALWPTPRPDRVPRYYWVALVPLDGPDNRSMGLCTMAVQVGSGRVWGRLATLNEAAGRISTSLDPMVASQALAEIAVPDLADYVTVDLVDAATLGREPLNRLKSSDTRIPGFYRGGVASLHGDLRGSPRAAGSPVFVPPASPFMAVLRSRTSHFEPVLDTSPGSWLDNDPFRAGIIRQTGAHSLMVVPLQADGALLGVAQFWRSRNPAPFSRADLVLAEDLAARASVSLDNAFRYTRGQTVALAMQRDLMQRRLSGGSAVEVASRYLPADRYGGVGGDWVDVIPLSDARVALVVGDVLGHGVNAAVTMGRLRAMVRALTKLEVPPDKLLALMDELVVDIIRDLSDADDSASSMIWATCLYGVYDPATRRCTLASAGHPPPAIVSPGGAVDFADVPPGAPIGVGTGSFHAIEVELAEGSVIALYSDGLIETRCRDVDQGLERLRTALARPVPDVEDLCASVIASLVPGGPSDDDIALLLAKTRTTTPGDRHAV